MGKIATEADVKSVGGKGTAVTNKCCTKEKATTFGVTLTKSRNPNLLVEEGTYVKTYDVLYLHCTTQVIISSNEVSITGEFTLSKNKELLLNMTCPLTFDFTAQFVNNNRLFILSGTFQKGSQMVNSRDSVPSYTSGVTTWNSVTFSPTVLNNQYQLLIGKRFSKV